MQNGKITVEKNEKEEIMEKSKKQMSDTFRLGAVLALAGGYMDAYSYLCRDEVFANAQTGNILLLGVNLAERNYEVALQYLCPIVAFSLGIIGAELVKHRMSQRSDIHWRQIAVLLEVLILFGVSFIPRGHSLIANSLISLACGIQVECFRKIHGNAIATTMCIGNLRSGTQNLCEYFFNKEKKYLNKCFLYYGIILFFTTGAVIGSIMIKYLQEHAIMISSVMLLVAFFMMFIRLKEEK